MVCKALLGPSYKGTGLAPPLLKGVTTKRTGVKFCPGRKRKQWRSFHCLALASQISPCEPVACACSCFTRVNRASGRGRLAESGWRTSGRTGDGRRRRPRRDTAANKRSGSGRRRTWRGERRKRKRLAQGKELGSQMTAWTNCLEGGELSDWGAVTPSSTRTFS